MGILEYTGLELEIVFLCLQKVPSHRYALVTRSLLPSYPQRDFNVINRPLHKWHLNVNNNIHTSIASHSSEKSFVLKHECEAKDVPSIVIQI